MTRAVSVQAVLLDLDGTLLDHVSAAQAAVLAWTRELAPDCAVPDAALTATWASLEAEHFATYLAGACTFEEQRRSRVSGYLPQLGIDPGTVDVDGAFARYLRHYESAWRAFPDVRGALPALREQVGVMAVLSNGDERQQRAKLMAIGVHSLLDAVLTSSMLGHAKPAAEAFHAACAAIGIDPAATVYVGDNPINDALAAEAAGLTGVWLDRSGGPVDLRVQRRISSLRELGPLLNEGSAQQVL